MKAHAHARPGAPTVSTPTATVFSVLCLGIAATSTGAILARLALTSGATALVAAGYRVGVAALIVVALAAWRRSRSDRDADDELTVHRRAMLRWAGPIAGIALALHFGLWIASLAWTSVSSSVALVTSHPFMVATASAYLIGEWPTRGMLAGVSLAAAGVLVIAVGDGLAEPGHLRGDLLALGGAAAFAAYIVVARRARAVVPLVEYLAVVYTVAALALLGAAILAGQPLSGFPSGVWALLAAAALIPQLVGHSSLNWALSHLSATYVSGVTLAEILGSGALAWVVFEEQPAGRTVVGAALIVAGLVTATRAERRRLGSLGPVANR